MIRKFADEPLRAGRSACAVHAQHALRLHVACGGGDAGARGSHLPATDDRLLCLKLVPRFAGFHLEDPDDGDYFVVQVFKDPYYGTPLFFTNGGASSCQHEANTARRSRPMIEVNYIGPAVLLPGEAALFEVTVSNGVEFYEENVRANVDR